MIFFYVVDFPQKKLSHIKIGTTKDLTRRLEQERRQYGGKAKILYVQTCDTSQEADDLEDISRVILRRTEGFTYKPKDRFLYSGARPPVPIPFDTDVQTDVRYV